MLKMDSGKGTGVRLTIVDFYLVPIRNESAPLNALKVSLIGGEFYFCLLCCAFATLLSINLTYRAQFSLSAM